MHSPLPLSSLSLAPPASLTEILDYRVNNSPLQFLVASGFQTQCAYVQVFNDGEFELVETFNLLLRSEDSSIVVINPIATVSIFDGGDRQL